MKEVRIWSLILWLSASVCVTTNHGLPKERGLSVVDERAGMGRLQPFKRMQNVVKGEEFKAGIPDLLANAGTIGTLAKIDYSGKPKQVFKSVGDAVLPIITTGLSMIPGGAIIGGVVAGIWGLFSPFLGGPAPKSPMEIMIDETKGEIGEIKHDIKEIKNELVEIRNLMAEMYEKIPEQMRKETRQTLSHLVHAAIHGQLSRNDYVCFKYALASQDFVADMKKNKTISESKRIELISLIHDCDNFLKDTAEAFAYPQFADVLWVPQIITTFIRDAFLTEITNFGVSLKIDPNMISVFWKELKKDMRRVFPFAAEGLKRRLETLHVTNREFKNFTEMEYVGCEMQSQLLYLDREMYPYGVPKQALVFDEDGKVNLGNYMKAGNNGAQHIQIYYNEIGKVRSGPPHRRENGMAYDRIVLLNCFMGPERISRVLTQQWTVHVTFPPGKTYLIKVLYLARESAYYHSEEDGGVVRSDFHPVTRTKPERKVSMAEDKDTYKITIEPGKANPNSLQRFVTKATYSLMTCDYHAENGISVFTRKCKSNGEVQAGDYVVETMSGIKVEAGKSLQAKIIIQNGVQELPDLFFGLEFVVLPNQ